MRCLCVISLLILGARAGVADDSTVIEWQQNRPLKWDDFRGAVPRGVDDERVAATAAAISWSYRYEIERSREQCTFSIVALNTAALFRPNDSWVKPGHRTAAILEHEQTHFDIARLYSEKFKGATHALVGSSHPCSGSSERRAARSAEAEIARLAGSVYEEVWREFRARQESYDQQTRHGINADEQARWTAEIDAAVRSAGL